MDKHIIVLHDLVESNGKTIKENNLEIKHKLHLGQKVYADIRHISKDQDIVTAEGVFYIISLDRDCDGTPLYSIAQEYDPDLWKIYQDYGWRVALSGRIDLIPSNILQRDVFYSIVKFSNISGHGYGEDSLKAVVCSNLDAKETPCIICGKPVKMCNTEDNECHLHSDFHHLYNGGEFDWFCSSECYRKHNDIEREEMLKNLNRV